MYNRVHEGTRVLIVDDNAFARSVGRRALAAAGVNSILDAASGQEAFDLLGRAGQTIDVVFCDLMMPDMDGIQLVRIAATLANPPSFVFLSGADATVLAAAENTARARGLRVLGAIEKPLTPKAVRRVLVRRDDLPPPPEADQKPVDLTPQEMDAALAKNQFLLYFQPKVSLTDGSIVGFESLVRWQHPELGLILPDAFISMAERSGRIGPLTEVTTKLALKQCAAWASIGLYPKVSVNLSAHMLVDLDLPDRMAGEAERSGVDPRQLILEVTESGLFQNKANTLDILARLHMKGFPLSIDDFGTGYSCMEQLRSVPFSEMKIDRVFVMGAAGNSRARTILESSAALGRSLQMCVVTEGVETQEDWDTVCMAGADVVQGFFIARPMAAELVPAWMSAFPHERRIIFSK
ncbi:EAL domain-containing response regulator [Oleispirillum naphthae]|uniref:EAL domain-containing response regulator n=1 Tax=Oleispirillum naphthae TaxID=2838853 RepID=UPI0030822D53